MASNAFTRWAFIIGICVPIIPLAVEIISHENDFNVISYNLSLTEVALLTVINDLGNLVNGELFEVPVRGRRCN